MHPAPHIAAAPPSLSSRLREETREVHRAAERESLFRDLLRGALTRDVYSSYLAARYRVYAALEAAIEHHREHPCVAPLRWPALRRADALARDLGALLGAGWIGHVTRDMSSRLHESRIVAVTASEPALLVGHAYVLYLGDLSGGQILRGAVARLAPDAVAAYEFPGLDVEPARQEFRARLDALPLGPAAAAAVVAEARLAFTLHGALAAAVMTRPVAAPARS